MGKQSRRTHRHKKGNNNNQTNNKSSYDKTSSKTDDSTSSSSSTAGTGSTILINRIRHGDARVRHGALAALSSTILSSESLIASASSSSSSGPNKSSGGSKQIINMELIQAICERVMDDDMPCAICAAGCLGNYILFGLYDTNTATGAGGLGKNRIDGTAVETLLTPILLSRMNKIGDAIYSTTQTTLAASTDDTSTTTTTITTTTADASSNLNNNNNNKKKNKNKPATASTSKAEKLVLAMMEQWSLASLTLRALCGLVEGTSTSSTNDTDNCVSPSSSILFHHRTSFLEVCPRLFNLGSETLKIIAAASANTTTTTTGASASTTKILADDEIENGTISDAVIYAARTLHASCDENPTLVSSLASLSTPTSTPSMDLPTTSPNNTNNSTWDTIVSSVQNDTLPTLARLHCAGIVTIARHLLTTTDTIPSSSASADRLDTTFTSMIIPYLHHSFATTPLLLPQQQEHPIINTNTNTTVPTTTKTTQITNLSNAIHKAELGLQKEANDKHIERQIIRASTIRKESSRSIARRQKIMKRDKIAAEKLKKEVEAEEQEKRKEGGDGDAAMEEDGDGHHAMTPGDDAEDGSTKEEEANERYDRAVTVWNDACLPLKLSLEIVTNLCAAVGAGLDDTAGEYYGNDNDDDGEEDDGAMNMDTEMAWDSDREEKLMAEVQQERRQQEKKEQFPTTDTTEKQRRMERQQVVTSSGVPDRVLDVFGTILLFLLSPPATPTSAFDPNNTKLTMADEINDTSSTTTGHPEVVTQDLIEILSKCGTCLGNVLGNLSDWKRTDVEVAPIFKDLIASLKEISARQPLPSIGGMAPSAYFGIIATLSSTMAAFLQFRPVLMGCVQTDELDLILSCALIQERQPPQSVAAGAGTITGNSNSNDNDADDRITTAILISDIQKDAISMLGMLSSQPHPHEVNVKMCTALVALLTRSTPSATSTSAPPPTTHVMNEVLNVLMDMYSADAGDPNNHEDVFQVMGVLGVFQGCAPIFKRMIRQEKMSWNNPTLSSSSSSSMDNITMWNETALNVTRFVRYKKGR